MRHVTGMEMAGMIQRYVFIHYMCGMRNTEDREAKGIELRDEKEQLMQGPYTSWLSNYSYSSEEPSSAPRRLK